MPHKRIHSAAVSQHCGNIASTSFPFSSFFATATRQQAGPHNQPRSRSISSPHSTRFSPSCRRRALTPDRSSAPCHGHRIQRLWACSAGAIRPQAGRAAAASRFNSRTDEPRPQARAHLGGTPGPSASRRASGRFGGFRVALRDPGRAADECGHPRHGEPLWHGLHGGGVPRAELRRPGGRRNRHESDHRRAKPQGEPGLAAQQGIHRGIGALDQCGCRHRAPQPLPGCQQLRSGHQSQLRLSRRQQRTLDLQPCVRPPGWHHQQHGPGG